MRTFVRHVALAPLSAPYHCAQTQQTGKARPSTRQSAFLSLFSSRSSRPFFTFVKSATSRSKAKGALSRHRFVPSYFVPFLVPSLNHLINQSQSRTAGREDLRRTLPKCRDSSPSSPNTIITTTSYRLQLQERQPLDAIASVDSGLRKLLTQRYVVIFFYIFVYLAQGRRLLRRRGSRPFHFTSATSCSSPPESLALGSHRPLSFTRHRVFVSLPMVVTAPSFPFLL